jgi:hypothetical protein
MGPANEIYAGLRQPEVPDLAFGDEVFHCTRHIFNRHLRIDAVLIEQVEAVVHGYARY